jgi:hypothetical protein
MTFKGPQPVIVNGDMSGDLISEVTIIDQLRMASYSIVWIGASPVGNVSVQVSDDYSLYTDGGVRNPGTWNTLPLSAPTPVSGNFDHGFIDIDCNAGYALRLLYSATSGTGTMNVVLMGK